MKITNNTTLRELLLEGVIEEDVYRYLKGQGYKVVHDVFSLSTDSVTQNSQKKELKTLVSFLRDITFFFWWKENEDKYSDIDTEFLFPNELFFTIRLIYQKEIKRYNADYIFNLLLYDESDVFFLSFFYQLITEPKDIFDENLFKGKLNRDDFALMGIDVEYERYKYTMTSIIVNIVNALANFPDCKYYKKLIENAIRELEINKKQLDDAEVFVSLLNYHPSNVEVFDTGVSSSVVSLDDEIQNKYEELQENLSTRTRNVIKQNIPKYLDFMAWVTGEKKVFSFRNCGKKSIVELEGFLSAFKDFYAHNTVNLQAKYKVNPDYVKTLSFLIELGVNNKLNNTEEYRCMVNIYPKWEDLSIDMSNMEGIYEKVFKYSPQQTLDCLNWLADLFSDIVLLIANKKNFTSYVSVFSLANKSIKRLIKENKTELEYQKYISDEKELMIVNTFEYMLSKTSVQCQNVVTNNGISYRILLTYEGREQDFLNICHVGRKCAEEMELLLCSFKAKYEKILKGNDNNAKAGNLISKFPYLSESDIVFVSRFDLKYRHLPMFYILLRYFENTSNRKAQIFASFCGLTNNPVFSLEGLSEKYNLTRERVRQIIEKRDFSSDSNYRVLINQELWHSYDIEFTNYLSISNSQYKALCDDEQVAFPFYTYCNILTLFRDVRILNISETGKVLSSLDVEQFQAEKRNFTTYAYDSRYRYFRFAPAMNEVGRLIHLQKDTNIKIPLYECFITNSDYWINNQYSEDEKTCRSLLCFFEQIIYDVYGDYIDNHSLILKANKLDYAQIMYEILKSHGKRMSLQDIFNQFKCLYPNSKYDDAKQIRHFLFKDGRIKNVGRSAIYTLSEWNDYTGSLFALAVVIVESKEAPMNTANLVKEMLSYRSSSTVRSVKSIISQCISEGKLIMYYGDLVGSPKKEYDGKYIVLPHSFNEWISAFKVFTIQNSCFPICSSKGFEGALYNWYNGAKTFINLSSEEIIEFHQMMKDFERIPHTLTEKKFLDNCERYKGFVKQTRRMISLKDDKTLYYWFMGNMKRYTTYEDQRRLYFKELINFLQEAVDIL